MTSILCRGTSLSGCQWMAGPLVRPGGFCRVLWIGVERTSRPPCLSLESSLLGAEKKPFGLHWIKCGWTVSNGGWREYFDLSRIHWKSLWRVISQSRSYPLLAVPRNCWFLLLIMSNLKWLFSHRTCSVRSRMRNRRVVDSILSGTEWEEQ